MNTVRDGDSLRRQMDNAEEYASQNGMILDTSLGPDLAVSAFAAIIAVLFNSRDDEKSLSVVPRKN
jgi:hypothetical protein